MIFSFVSSVGMKPPICRRSAKVDVVRGCLLTIVFLLVASPTSAQRLQWAEEWSEPGVSDVISAGALFTGALAISLGSDALASSWQQAGPIDDALAEGLSLASARARSRASTASYVFGGLALSMPIGDVAVAFADNPDVAVNLAQITTLSFASVTLATSFLKYVVLRTRPNAGECQTASCAASRYRSFPSGHSSLAFTAASLSCTYHLRVGIYGSRGADIAACGTSLAFAFTTAILRMVARKHYLSDVLVGGALGVLAGWVLPSLLYLGFGD